jgi:hypothetical protein
MEEQKLLPLDVSLLSEDVIEILLSDTSTEPSFFEEVARKNTHRPEILRCLLNHPLTPDTTRHFVAQALNLPVPKPAEVRQEAEKETAVRLRGQSLLQRIQRLRAGEKLQLALRANREIRSILLRDPNKEVMLAVLDNPKITETEIELIARQKAIPVEILRTIAQRREWIRNYSIIHALVTNPKTPIAIALKHVHALRHRDLSILEKDRNISEPVRAAARRLLKARKSS